jgi:hypothetical protein
MCFVHKIANMENITGKIIRFIHDDDAMSILEGSHDDMTNFNSVEGDLDDLEMLDKLANMSVDEDDVGRPDENTTTTESDFCSSVRNKDDGGSDRPRFNLPTYKDRMVGLSAMIFSWCGTDLSSLSTIAHISEWRPFKTTVFPLSVRVRMKSLEDITMLQFVECYRRMEELYDEQMVKESSTRRILHFHDYCEDLVEFWALADLTLNMLVSEERSGLVSLFDLLQFAKTRLSLASVIERVVLHHFHDLHPGGGARVLRSERAAKTTKVTAEETVEESRVLASFRVDLKEKDVDDHVYSKVSTDNVNHDLFLQVMSVNRLYNDSSKSAKRKMDLLNQEAAKRKMDLLNQEADKPNGQAGDDVFIQTVQSFADHLIARYLHNQPTDEDMMQFMLTEFKVVTDTYQKKKGI